MEKKKEKKRKKESKQLVTSKHTNVRMGKKNGKNTIEQNKYAISKTNNSRGFAQ